MAQRGLMGIMCSACKSLVPVNSPSPLCMKCQGRLEVMMDLETAKERIAGDLSSASGAKGVWRYGCLLPPLNPKDIVSLGEGNTSLLRSELLAQVLGSRSLFIKDETTNPTGAFIDRGTTVEVSRAKALAFRAAACGWSGNLSASMAAYCARGGLRSRAYLPGHIDLGKLYQAVAYGAEIIPCSTRDEAFDNLISGQHEFYPVTARNPFFLEGVKTTGIEIVEQLKWHPPDWMILPMGNGSHLAMTYKGLREIEALGIVKENHTRLVGVQAEGCSPIADMVRARAGRRKPVDCTFARDIAIEKPAMAQEAVSAIKQSRGDVAVVSEKEVLDGVELLAKNEGIFAEPASASTVVALRKLLEAGTISRSDSVVCVITGIGLKDPLMARNIALRNKAARTYISMFGESVPARRIGESKFSILRILSEGGNYAYAVRKRLVSQRGKPMSLVSVFQHLKELQELGLVFIEKQERSRQRRMRVYYSLTPKGRELIK